MKQFAALALLLAGSAAHADVALQACPSYKPVGGAITGTVVVSDNQAGAPQSTVKCQTLAETLPTWFVKVTTDGGQTWNFVPLVQVDPPTEPAAAQAILTWAPVTTDAAGKPLAASLTYNVYRGSSATTLTKLTNVAQTTYTDPAGSATPTTYYYAVTATCAACVESAQSAVVKATIQAGKLTPAAPGAITVH